jgi:hypothetical protein
VLAGGVFAGCAALRAAFSDRLAAAGAAASIPVLDPAGSLFQSLAGTSDPVPGSWLGSAVWTLEPAGQPLARRC